MGRKAGSATSAAAESRAEKMRAAEIDDDFFESTFTAQQAEQTAEAGAEAAHEPQETVSDAGGEKTPAGTKTQQETAADKVEALEKIVAELQAQLAERQTPTIVQMAAPDVQKVQFLWQAEVCDENVYFVGDGGMYGRITGKFGTFYVPKSDLSRAMNSMFRYMLDKRWIIYVSGLDAEERAAYGVDYKDGEILDRGAFVKLVDLGDELLRIYPQLCDGHKEIVAKRWNEAWNLGNANVTRQRTMALKRMAKEAGRDPAEYDTVIEAMNAADAL